MDIIHIGEKAIISQGAHLCAGTHDISDADFQLITKPIIIERGAWVAAEAFIGPGVVVKEYAVVGARAAVFRNADAFGIYVGNPAKFIKKRVFRARD
jgi:putative colanic acid biosynthesis acetyltransferase WcaF